MRADRLRFKPPECERPPALRWTLERAFASAETAPSVPQLAPSERSRVLDWGRALALVERIAGRLPRSRAEAELGATVADQMFQARTQLAARSLLLQQLLDQTAARAAELGCPLVALKGIALLESGAAAWGGRPLVDLDLLVEPERAHELATALRRTVGLRPSGPDERHHLPPLADPRLGELELHVALPGLSLAGSTITPGHLRQAGLVEPSARLGGLLLPTPPLLAAHLISHTLDQHGLSPTAYPITRLAADLLDLAAATDQPLAELVRTAAPLLDRSVSERELEAVAALGERLAMGLDRGLDADARALLDHSIAALVQPRYRRALRRRAAVKALGRGDWRKLRLRPRAAAEN